MAAAQAAPLGYDLNLIQEFLALMMGVQRVSANGFAQCDGSDHDFSQSSRWLDAFPHSANLHRSETTCKGNASEPN